MKVKNFYNKNQFIIEGKEGITFQSYESEIANITPSGRLILHQDWNYSKTTLKHLYLFLQDYKNNLENFIYSRIVFHVLPSNNKRKALQKEIDNKTIKFIA